MTTEQEPFAVDLSNDGIFLWHRKPAKKWEFVGSVPLNSGNLRQQLEALKTAAMDISAPSSNAIVRIPTAEVHTLTVAYDTTSETSWEVRIVSALEAASGAAIKTLAFDIDRGDGTSDISVAWTPMAVIEQAETFVHLIGFNPTTYTTDVDAVDFPRNPNFQLSDYQATPDDISYEQNRPNTVPLEASLSPPPDAPHTKYPKGDFGFIWFIVLIAILSMLIAGIYFWPNLQQSSSLEPNLRSDKLILAIAHDNTAIHFENNRTIL